MSDTEASMGDLVAAAWKLFDALPNTPVVALHFDACKWLIRKLNREFGASYDAYDHELGLVAVTAAMIAIQEFKGQP